MLKNKFTMEQIRKFTPRRIINNRRITYIKEDLQYPFLKTVRMILCRESKLVDGNMIEVKKKILIGENNKSM